uniref:Ankyrin repeat domain-containing protein 49 n=1 Tax=Cacopsylla melanoneura TaxID=428564 RepID=A0A8D9AB98_9HEMI
MSDDEDSNELIDKMEELREKVKDGTFNLGQVSAWDDDIVGIEDTRNPKDENQRKILEAAENNDKSTLEALLNADISLLNAVDKDGYSPLHRACYNGHADMVNILIQRGADIKKTTIDGWMPLHSACKWNNTECVTILLNYGADINAQTNGGLTPLHLAASHSHSRDILMILLSHPNIDPHILSKGNETAQEIARRSGIHYGLFEVIEPCFNELSKENKI